MIFPSAGDFSLSVGPGIATFSSSCVSCDRRERGRERKGEEAGDQTNPKVATAVQFSGKKQGLIFTLIESSVQFKGQSEVRNDQNNYVSLEWIASWEHSIFQIAALIHAGHRNIWWKSSQWSEFLFVSHSISMPDSKTSISVISSTDQLTIDNTLHPKKLLMEYQHSVILHHKTIKSQRALAIFSALCGKN